MIVHIITRIAGERKVIRGADFPKTGDFFPERRQNEGGRAFGMVVIPASKELGHGEVRHNAGKELAKRDVDNAIAK